ncbi:hypothetical protein FRC10_004201 [Ceratobasidium sp. 414]|nr:hypothetical protein FRC10_004201 [Ceratobasidium sp. 414]
MDVAAGAASVMESSRYVGLVRLLSENDARRPATKQLVESLRVKIQVLEAEVARLRDSGFAHSPLGAEGLSGHVLPPVPAGSNVSDSPPAEIPSASPPDSSMPATANQFAATVMYKYIFQINTALPTNEQPADTQLSLACHWNRYLPDLDNTQFSRAEHDTLLSRCFKYGTSWLLGLVPEIFLHDMLYSLSSASSDSHSTPQARLQHYTPMLHCAIMAFASAFSDDPTIRSRATREKFAVHAKRWLDEEIGQPVMGLVRSLALLAEYHCALGQREAGYMYMGMSIRATRAMISAGQRAEWVGQGIVSYPESTAREWHFWSTFAQGEFKQPYYAREVDNRWVQTSLWTPDMPIPHSGVNLPFVESELDSQPWPTNPTETLVVNKNQPKMTTLTFLESCKLLVIATRILEAALPFQQSIQGDTAVLNLHLIPGSIIYPKDSWSGLDQHAHYPTLSCSTSVTGGFLYICTSPATTTSSRLTDPCLPRVFPLKCVIAERTRLFNCLISSTTSMVSGSSRGICFRRVSPVVAISSSGEALLRENASSPPGAAKKRATAYEGAGVCLQALRTVSVTWPCAEVLADELEARIEEQRPPSNVESEMEVDELADDPIAAYDLSAEASRMSYSMIHDQLSNASA